MFFRRRMRSLSYAEMMAILVLLMSFSSKLVEGARPLDDMKPPTLGANKVFSQQDRVNVSPSAPDHCTYIPKPPGDGPPCNK
jgi:hypothetical protein